MRALLLQIRKKKWRPINLERLDLLAQPRVYKMPMIRDPLVIAKQTLMYKITQRIKNLATREKPSEIPLRIPGAVSLAALKAIGNTQFDHYYSLYADLHADFSLDIPPSNSNNATTRLREILSTNTITCYWTAAVTLVYMGCPGGHLFFSTNSSANLVVLFVTSVLITNYCKRNFSRAGSTSS